MEARTQGVGGISLSGGSGEPLSPEMEKLLQTAVDDVLITPPPGMSYRAHRESILRAFAREILQQKCECGAPLSPGVCSGYCERDE